MHPNSPKYCAKPRAGDSASEAQNVPADILFLQWKDIAGGSVFHAALVNFGGGCGTLPHTHDFWETMYVLDGQGAHTVDGETHVITRGQLLLIRPWDCHMIRALPGQRLVFINVAFEENGWREFARIAGLEDDVRGWSHGNMPRSVNQPGSRQEHAGDIYRRALAVYYQAPSRLELCRFWIEMHVLLKDESANESVDSGPDWLLRACRAMREDANLSAGLSRFIALSGVSSAHLSRTLKSHTGQTPTEYLNHIRLARAAALLATTTEEILDIAYDCGFENLSYFYRLFHRTFHQTPREYRLSAYRAIAP